MPRTIHMSAEDHRLVTAAVAAAEAETSGEIVTIVTDLSDPYRETAYAWASIAAFLALSAVALFPDFYRSHYEGLLGGWTLDYTPGQWLGIATAFAALKWIGTFLILQWLPLRLALTPRLVKARRVRARALKLFRVGAEARTAGRTGVLLYLSLREHRADIVADEAIAAKVTPDVWGDTMVALLGHVRAGRAGVGMAEAVGLMGHILADHFPIGSENPNELADRLIEL
jgi:putative membrane protein